jgi:hypothetical protein
MQDDQNKEGAGQAHDTASPPESHPLRNTAIFLAFVVIVVGFLYSISGERTNRIPDTEDHRELTEPATCLERCHGPEGPYPRSAQHPPKDQCMLCHTVKKVRKFE